ncbi:MAG: hypothetical protein BWY25_02444 [Chloroflexi bacterium ADurb.Bin222]|nr:MAG: hypothetical protein BWY25_02444 [Chloroflexi bacterium ADurb.Bin222]
MRKIWFWSIALMGLTLAGLCAWASCDPRSSAWAAPLPVWAAPLPLSAATEPLTGTLPSTIYLPLAAANYNQACEPIPGASYAALSVVRKDVVPDAENDAGYNLGLLGYELTGAYRGLVDYDGDDDPLAPQFPFLFGDQRVPNFPNVYRLYHGWGEPVTDWPVTMLGMEVADFEILHVPERGDPIDPQGYEVMVIYASEQRVALNYGREDSLRGYTLYIENVCVEPSLLTLYRQLNAAGRNELPALFGSQALGRATTSEIRVVIRDAGSAMDPRSRKDWWRGR